MEREHLIWILIAISVLAGVGVAAVHVVDGVGQYRAPLTLVASSGFVVAALVAGALDFNYGRLVLGALIFCWLGDMFGPMNFMVGAGAFLGAHVLLIPAYFCLEEFEWNHALIGGLLVAVVCGMILLGLVPQVPTDDRAGVVVYVITISLMLTAALGVIEQNRLIPVAAGVFFVSDIFVGHWKFVGGEWYSPVCYPLYYTACSLFAYTTLLENTDL
jgi:uncharacterized membrane protein YhhN